MSGKELKENISLGIAITSLVMACVALLCSCASGDTTREVKHEPTQEERAAQRLPKLQKSHDVFEVECNGHLYVIASGYHAYSGVAMLHSPNCPCQEGGGK